MKRKRAVPLGSATLYTPEELATLALITPHDIEYAKTDAARHASAAMLAVLLSGKQRPRDELDKYTTILKNDVSIMLAERLRNRQISIAEFQSEMMRIIKDVHINSASFERGGYANMTARDYALVAALVLAQYEFLLGFAEQLESGEQLRDGTLRNRITLYTSIAIAVYYSIKQAHLPTEATHIGSILNPADHCSECVGLDGKWFPIGGGGYVPIGGRICLSNCRCRERYGANVDGTVVEL